MDSIFIQSLKQKARARRARIGIWNADAALIASLQSAAEHADLLQVGDPGCDCDLDCTVNPEPWKDLVRLLAVGEIEGAVRVNLPAGRTMGALSEQFGLPGSVPGSPGAARLGLYAGPGGHR